MHMMIFQEHIVRYKDRVLNTLISSPDLWLDQDKAPNDFPVHFDKARLLKNIYVRADPLLLDGELKNCENKPIIPAINKMDIGRAPM